YWFDTSDNSYKPLITDGIMPITQDVVEAVTQNVQGELTNLTLKLEDTTSMVGLQKQNHKRLFDLIPHSRQEKMLFKKHDNNICHIYTHYHDDIWLQHKFGNFVGNFTEASPLARGSGDSWFRDYVRQVKLTQTIATSFADN